MNRNSITIAGISMREERYFVSSIDTDLIAIYDRHTGVCHRFNSDHLTSDEFFSVMNEVEIWVNSLNFDHLSYLVELDELLNQ